VKRNSRRMVNHTTLAMLLLPMAMAQDDVQVDCTPDHMEIRVTKAVVDTMGFASADVHLEEPDCKFGEIDDGQFYIYRMSPLTACGTEVKLNGTHVEYKNKLIAGNDQSVLEKGAVIVGTADSSSRQALAAKLKCLFPIELMVSTAFLPNISHVTIPLPPAYGIGKFMASMQLFKTEFYEQPYQNNPELTTADYLNVETRLLGNFTDDIFIRMQRCWATPTEDSQSETSFDLLEDGCASDHAADQGMILFAIFIELQINNISNRTLLYNKNVSKTYALQTKFLRNYRNLFRFFLLKSELVIAIPILIFSTTFIC
jgi:hypothetical protein